MKLLNLSTASLMVVIASSVLLINQATAVEAEVQQVEATQHSHHAKRHHDHKGGMHKMLRKLSLTDAQKADVKLIITKYREDGVKRPSKEQMTAHKAEMFALISNANFDEAKAETLIQDKQQMHAQKALMHLKMQNEIFQILTPEQQQKFQQRFEQGRRSGKAK